MAFNLDIHREKTLRTYLRQLAARSFVPDRILVDAEQSALPGLEAQRRGKHPTAIFIREDGWTVGAPREYQEAASKLYEDKWLGALYGPASATKDMWIVQLRAKRGYWVDLGRFDPLTGELREDDAMWARDPEQATAEPTPSGRDIQSLRDWLRKG